MPATIASKHIPRRITFRDKSQIATAGFYLIHANLTIAVLYRVAFKSIYIFISVAKSVKLPIKVK